MPPEHDHDKYERVVAAASALAAVPTAIAHPCDDVSIQSAIEAARIKLIEPILVESEEHVDWLETQLGLIEAVGLQNYLTEQMGGHDGGGH